jgi:hypothetical protein
MARYLTESYPASSDRALDARRSARRLAELEPGLRDLRTTFIPGDETILHLSEAPSAEALDRAGRLAALRFDRIVEALEGKSAAMSGSSQRERAAEPQRRISRTSGTRNSGRRAGE